jgi:general secretion pathway protein B
MSYVLDALRRAESERQRGRVPGLDAQPLPAPTSGAATAGPARRGAGGWLAGLALLAGVAIAGWWFWPAAESPPPAPAAALPSARPSPPPPAARPAPPVALPRPVQPPLPAATRPPPRPAVAASAAVPATALSTTPPAGFPALAFSGSIDSPQPEARMLIVNGQVWREGDELVAGLKLERISLRSAVFVWRGQRVEVATDRPAGR